MKSLLHNLGVAHLAYRIVASTSMDLVEKYAAIEKTEAFRADLMGIEYASFDRESEYEQVFYLMTHEAETHVEDLFKYSLTSALLGKHFMRAR